MPSSPGDKYTVVWENNAAPAIPSTIGSISVGATKRVWLTELNIGSKSAIALAGAKLSLNRAADAGTGGAAVTPRPVDPSAPAAVFTSKSATTIWSVEPGTLVVLYQIGLNAVGSMIWTPPEPIMFNVSTFGCFRIEVDASSTKVNWVVTATFQE
jgi:hypothetical protein